MGKIEKKCPTCYHKMPQPKEVLGPCDDELNYFMWIPGFEWKPEPEPEDDYTEGYSSRRSRGEAEDEDMEEALEEMVEADEMKNTFNEQAEGGKVTSEKAAKLSRQLGLAPSYEDQEKFEREHGDRMDYTTFQNFAAKSTHPEDRVEDLQDALSFFDTSKSGFLTKKQLRNILQTFGEPLTAEEVDAMMGRLCDSDPVNITQFCEKLLARD